MVIPTKKQIGRTYRQFSRRKYTKYRHQFPRMKESEVVSKVIKEWESLTNKEKEDHYKQFREQKAIGWTDESSVSVRKRSPGSSSEQKNERRSRSSEERRQKKQKVKRNTENPIKKGKAPTKVYVRQSSSEKKEKKMSSESSNRSSEEMKGTKGVIKVFIRQSSSQTPYGSDFQRQDIRERVPKDQPHMSKQLKLELMLQQNVEFVPSRRKAQRKSKKIDFIEPQGNFQQLYMAALADQVRQSVKNSIILHKLDLNSMFPHIHVINYKQHWYDQDFNDWRWILQIDNFQCQDYDNLIEIMSAIAKKNKIELSLTKIKEFIERKSQREYVQNLTDANVYKLLLQSFFFHISAEFIPIENIQNLTLEELEEIHKQCEKKEQQVKWSWRIKSKNIVHQQQNKVKRGGRKIRILTSSPQEITLRRARVNKIKQKMIRVIKSLKRKQMQADRISILHKLDENLVFFDSKKCDFVKPNRRYPTYFSNPYFQLVELLDDSKSIGLKAFQSGKAKGQHANLWREQKMKVMTRSNPPVTTARAWQFIDIQANIIKEILQGKLEKIIKDVKKTVKNQTKYFFCGMKIGKKNQKVHLTECEVCFEKELRDQNESEQSQIEEKRQKRLKTIRKNRFQR